MILSIHIYTFFILTLLGALVVLLHLRRRDLDFLQHNTIEYTLFRHEAAKQNSEADWTGTGLSCSSVYLSFTVFVRSVSK